MLQFLTFFSILRYLLSSQSPDNCPDGYTEGVGSYGPSCYKFGMTPMTWQSARQDCRATPNSDLVIIENAIENRFIRDLSGGVDWWIGEMTSSRNKKSPPSPSLLYQWYHHQVH